MALGKENEAFSTLSLLPSNAFSGKKRRGMRSLNTDRNITAPSGTGSTENKRKVLISPVMPAVF